MAAGGLKIDARRKRILELLSRDGRVVVSELSRELEATTVTIRNDLDALERDGYLERIQGGAVQKVKNYYNFGFQGRAQENSEIKKMMGAAAAEQIHDGATLFINSGSTMYYTAVALKKHKNLNIVTNSLAVAVELGSVPSFRVILLGGEINAQYSFVCGGDAQEQLRRYTADYALLSLDGVSAEGGITTYHADEALINRMMVERAKKSIVVADHSKMGKVGFSFICDLSSISTLVTDRACEEDVLDTIRSAGVEVVNG